MYPFYDQLGLTDDQKDRVTRVAEAYDLKINDLQKRIELSKRNPALGRTLIAMVATLRKLINDRQKLLDTILTEVQREKYRTVKGGQNVGVQSVRVVEHLR